MSETHGPLAAGERIPAARYSSRSFARLEWDRMWTRVWLLAGHVGRVARPGDFFTLELGSESLLVARGEDDRVRAFYNVCQHRGMILCPRERGHAQGFTCGYHHFRYRLDGRLAEVPLPQEYAGGAPEETVRLAELGCAVRLGFVWVSMSPAPVPIDDYLAPVAPLIAAYRPERFRIATATTVEVACNWKLSSDVNNEGYHVRSLHPELCRVADDRGIEEHVLGLHSRITVPLGAAARDTPWEGTIPDELRALAGSWGLVGFDGTAAELRPALARAVRAKAESDGVDLSALGDEALTEKRQFYVFPNVQLNFTPRALELYRHRPSGDDPTAALFDEEFYELAPAGAAPREPLYRRVRHGEVPLGPVMGADVDLLPGLQRGVSSRGFAGLLLGSHEVCIENMHRALDQFLFGVEVPDADPR
jgi:phenylpropionate dioxygenase-like ring-hydroxylating dioxygenase large terminal subunit